MKKSLLFLSVLTAISIASCGGSDIDTSKIALDYGYDYKNDIVNIEEVEKDRTGKTYNDVEELIKDLEED